MHAMQLRSHRLGVAAPHKRVARLPVAVHCSKPNTVEEAKRAAARLCVDTFVRNGTLVALGPGEMATLVIAEVGQRLASGRLQGVSGVPVSDVAAHEAAFHGVPLVPEARVREASVVVADADQLDVSANAALVGGSSEPQQPDIPRLLAALTPDGPKLVLLTESSRVLSRLSGSLPVWLDADGWEEPAEGLDDIFLGDAELWRRSFDEHPANPRGGDLPYVSPQGLTIVDIRFYEGLKLYGENEPYERIVEEIGTVEGIVAHGLLVKRAAAAVVARPDEPEPLLVEFS